MPKRVAIYARVSTQEQVENGNSLEFQIDKLKAYCQLHELKVVGEYIDAGVSGAKFSRPALNRLKDDIDKIDIVLIYKLDRLSRSIKNTMFLIEDIFKPNNVDLISLSENFDTSQAVGMAMIAVISTFAQLERETIKERMMAGKLQAVKNGKYINNAPFGYKKVDGKLVKDEDTRKCVEFIFEKLLEGHSTTKIAKMIELNGYAKLRTALWHFNTINRFVHKKVYCGHTPLMDILVKNTHEPYITDEEQDYILKLINSRKCSPSKAYDRSFPAVFRGMINCPTCHRKMAVSRAPKKGVKKDKLYLIRYRCPYCKLDKKGNYYLPEELIEEALLKYFKEFCFNFKFKKNKVKPPTKDFDKKISVEENKKFKLQKAWLNNLINDEELKKLQLEIEAKIELLKKEQQEQFNIIENQNKEIKIKDFVLKFNEIFAKITDEEKIKLLHAFIDDISLDIETIKISEKRNKYKVAIRDVNFK